LAPLQSVVLWQMRQSLRNIWRKLFATCHTFTFKQCLNATPLRMLFMSLLSSLEQAWDQFQCIRC